MSRTLVSLVSEQTAPNLMLLLDPAFQQADRYLFVSTPQMNEMQQLDYLLDAAKLPASKVQILTVPAFEPARIYQVLEAECPSQDVQYWVNLTGGTKMMALAVWAYFTQPNLQAECFYVSLGENNCRRIFPFQQAEVMPLQYRFSLRTYLTAYGIAEQDNPQAYQRNPSLEAKLFRDTLSAHKPLDSMDEPIWWFANYLEYLRTNVKKPKRPQPHVRLDREPWVVEWLQYIGYQPKQEEIISQTELRYLTSAWFEHYIHDVIADYLKLPSDAIASQAKLYQSSRHWKYSNHEFDVIFLYRNRLYVIECKTAISRNRTQTRRLFDEAIYRLAALKRDFGLNVTVGLVVLTDQLRRRKQFDPAFAKRADLLKVALIDQTLLAAGPAEWVPVLIRQN